MGIPRAKHGRWYTRESDDPLDGTPDLSPGVLGSTSTALDEAIYDVSEADDFIDGGGPTTTFQDDLDGGSPDPAEYLDGGAP